MPSSSWVERLLELICKIYEQFDGDCAELTTPEGAIATVVNAYNTNGAPQITGESERQSFLDDLTDLEDHLALPGNTLSATDSGLLSTLIDDLRQDIEAQGS